MSQLILKTELTGSNPKVIRQFTIKEDRTVSDLLKAVCLMHGWKADTDMKLVREEQTVAPEKQLSELFPGGTAPSDPLSLVLTKPVKRTFGQLKDPEKWYFLLKLVAVKESDEEEQLKLLRFRGLNPDPNSQTVPDWNGKCEELERQGIWFSYQEGSQRIESFCCDTQKINNQLSHQILHGMEELHVNYGNAAPLQTILSSETVENMKNLIRSKGLPCDYNCRKAQLIEEICRYFRQPEHFLRIFDEMDLKEYLSFRELVTRNEEVSVYSSEYALGILYQYLMLGRTYSGTIIFAEELLKGYEELLQENGDAGWILQKKARNVLLAASYLYGVFTLQEARCLSEVMFPEEKVTDYLMKEWKDGFCWRMLQSRASAGARLQKLPEKVLPEEILYNYYDITEQIAVDILFYRKKAGIPAYLPSKEEAEKIAVKGLTFSPQAVQKLSIAKSRLHDRYYYQKESDDRIFQEVCRFCHVGAPEEEIEQYLRNHYYVDGSKKDYQLFNQTVSEVRREVRLAATGGYTKEEYQRAVMAASREMLESRKETQGTRKAPEKIYPNDLCPCGSGKKYKFCHGRTGNQ